MPRESSDLTQPGPADQPLERLRAVVFTQAVAGAFTTKLLADMGAEVIQIESLTRPDPIRGGFPSPIIRHLSEKPSRGTSVQPQRQFQLAKHQQTGDHPGLETSGSQGNIPRPSPGLRYRG